MRSRYVGAALLGAVALFIGGCGPSNSDNTGDTGAGQPPATAATAGGSAGGTGGAGTKFAHECPTAAAVGGQLGMTFPGDPRVTKDTNAIACSYTGTRTSDNKAEAVLLFMRTGTTAADMARTRQQEVDGGNSPVTQSGVGDEAYSFQTQSINTTLNNLVVRKGDRVVQVGGNATLEQLTGLVNMLLAF